MPRKCTICAHEKRTEIDAALVRGEAAREISALFRVSEDAITRHKAAHIPASLAQAKQAEDVARGDDLLQQLRDLQKITMGTLARAHSGGDYRTVLAAVREARGNLELIGKLIGELQEQQTTVNVLIASPEWVTLRGRILSALMPYPEARAALVEVLNVGE